MADYKEGMLKSKQRARQVIITNELNQMPIIEFVEEITLTEGTKIISKTPVGKIMEGLVDPSTVFPMVHPDTGDALGEATYGQVYVLLYSLYRFLADRRDAPVPIPIVTPDPVIIEPPPVDMPPVEPDPIITTP